MSTTAVPSKAADVTQTVDMILSYHLVENELGRFRWRKLLSGNNVSKYELEFWHIDHLAWLKLRRRSRIVLVVRKKLFSKALYLRWQIISLSAIDLCKQIIRETEFEIACFFTLIERSPKK